MAELIKKGIYIKKEQMEEMAALVYKARKEQKRFVNESMLVRIGLDLLFKLPLDLTEFENEKDIREHIRSSELTINK